jgi:flavin reductase (DIM6/NTAB) family NADH-FMN oxidoreductase RutF
MTFDSKEFRRAAGQFLTGVTIVTVRADDGTPMGFTCNSFTSVSLDPPLVLVCLDKRGGSYGTFRVGRVYAVHVLEEHQIDLSTRFAMRGGDKFAGLNYREGLDGVPILPDYLALFECRIEQAHDAGDHTIFVGRVERLDVSDSERRPLGFYRGKYIRIHRHPAAYVPEEVVELWRLGWA